MPKKGGWQEFSSNAASTARPTATGSGPAGAPSPKGQQRVRVQRTKAGKGGKLVTAITGLEAPEAELKTLLKQLKAAAGTGGTIKDGVIELQGDQVAPAISALEQAKPANIGPTFIHLVGLGTEGSEIERITKGRHEWPRQPGESVQDLKDSAIRETPPPKAGCSNVFLCF